MKEREISLLDLLTEILLHWRGIVVCMAVGALLGGAFSYVRAFRASRDAQAEQQMQDAAEEGGKQQDRNKMQSDLEEQLTAIQIQNVRYVAAYEEMYQNKLAYQKRSIQTQIDPNRVQRADLIFYVEADNWRKAYSIEKVYEDFVQDGELGEYIAQQVGRDKTGNINELVYISRGQKNQTEGTDTFRVRAIHYDKAVLQDMAQAVIRFMEQKYAQVEKVMGKHRLAAADWSVLETADMDVLGNQKSLVDEIASMEAVILQYTDAFTDVQQRYYELLVTDTANASSTEDAEGSQDTSVVLHGAAYNNSQGNSVGISMKYLVLGMFLAVFMYVFIFFLRYVFNQKLCGTDNLQELYGIPQLGSIPCVTQKGKPFSMIDQRIMLLRSSHRRRFTRDEALRLAVAAVKMAAAKQGTGVICLTGCGLTGHTLAACEEIRDRLAEEGIEVRILNNILYDVKAMCSLEGSGAAVLVEHAGDVLYSEITDEIELLERQDIAVLGGIVSEA